ncbi:MAG TPA: response regulator [Flavisolibacter sp.]|nr:response regulator [Flavisolibacter sp.]
MKSRYIIFADDDADDLELITGFFKQYNQSINVIEFKNGKEVLKFLDDFVNHASKPLLIVLDINMPRLNGKETLAAIRKHPDYNNIPILVYTTSFNKTDEEYCKKYNASWINKPNNMEGVKQIARVIADFCQL